jgi:hypothetical protein
MSGAPFRRNGARYLRLRVENCVLTVLELNRKLGEGAIRPEIVKQFEKLKESLKFVTDDAVDEKDIHRIEDATNQLLSQIKVSEGDGGANALCDDPMH